MAFNDLVRVFVKITIANNSSNDIDWDGRDVPANTTNSYTVDYDRISIADIQELDTLNAKSNVTVTYNTPPDLNPDEIGAKGELMKTIFDFKKSITRKQFSVNVKSESNNTIPVEYQVIDGNGNDQQDVYRIRFDIFNENLKQINVSSDLGITITGNGSAISNTNETSLLMDTGSNGGTEISVEDKTTTSTATLFVRASFVNEELENYTTITFS